MFLENSLCLPYTGRLFSYSSSFPAVPRRQPVKKADFFSAVCGQSVIIGGQPVHFTKKSGMIYHDQYRSLIHGVGFKFFMQGTVKKYRIQPISAVFLQFLMNWSLT